MEKGNNTHNNIARFSGERLAFLNQLNQNEIRNQQNSNTPIRKEEKILLDSPIISKDDPNMIIYGYPEVKFSKNVNENCKIILFFGENKEMFISTLINIYRDITFEDKFRYKLQSSNSNGLFQIYNIKARSFKYHLKVICFPNFIKNKKDLLKYETILEFLDLFTKNKIPNRIHYIFITLDEAKKFDNNEIILFYIIINLFQQEKLKDKIIVFHSSNNFGEIQQQNLKLIDNLFKLGGDYFLCDDNFDSYFSSLFNPEFHYVNNKIIFDKNAKEAWKKLDEKIKLLENKISSCKSEEIVNNNKKLIEDIIKTNDINVINQNLGELKNYNRKEFIILLYFLINSNIKNDISKYILFSYDKIYESQKFCTTVINFVKGDKYFQRNLLIYSKIIFTNLLKISGINSDLTDKILMGVKNIFSSKLTLLNLSHNKFSELNIISKEAFNSIQTLDLSYNNISNITIFGTYKCNNLKTLNLSNNEIQEIRCFANDDLSNFKKLESLDLSNNKITKLNKVNIKSIKNINLLNNKLSNGIHDFINNNYFNNTHVAIINNNNKLIFNYSDCCMIKFEYLIEEKNINNLLNILSFRGIKSLVLDNFTNCDFLSNQSLINLTHLNLHESQINDITIFNKIKFINIEKIELGDNEIEKGFNSLYAFKSIRAYSIQVDYYSDENYFCTIKFLKPEMTINFIFDNLNFLRENLLNEDMKEINISNDIFNCNTNIFTFSAIKNNSFRLFKKLKANHLHIYYESNENKYKCYTGFNHNINMTFFFNDLNFLKDQIFNEVDSIKIYKGILKDISDLSFKRFPYLNYIELKYNIIEDAKIFNDIDEINKENEERKKYNEINDDKKTMIELKTDSNICNSNIVGLLVGSKFNLHNIETENKQIKLNFTKPFNFIVLMDKNKLNEIKYFSKCTEINLQNIELSNNDLNFLKDGSLSELKYLYLNINENTILSFLENIASQSLVFVVITSKISQNNLLYLNNNGFYCKTIDIKMNEEDKNFLKIDFSFYKNYNLCFDYLYEVCNNLIILKNMNLCRLHELKLANLNLTNINFLSNSSLYNLKILDLDSNKIEDISIFNKEKVSFNLDRLCLKNNPIKKGMNVLNSEFFKRSIYMELNVTKNNNEFKVCSYYKYPFYDIEFYVNSTNELINMFDYKNTFIKLNTNTNNLQEMKEIENIIRTNESIDNKKLIFEIIIVTINLRGNYYYHTYNTLNITYDNNQNEIWKNNNIYINDNNRIAFEKAFKWILDKKNNFQEYVFKLDNATHIHEPNFTNFNLYNLNASHENIILNFPFNKIYSLNLINCSFDLNILQKSNLRYLEKIDLSKSNVTDIRGLCGYVPFTNLKILDLSNNQNITNLHLLQEVRFKDLVELYLSNDNIKDLSQIITGDPGFYKLKILDLSHNQIQSLSPLKYFRNLRVLNLEHNLINNETEYNYIIDVNERIQLRTIGNPATGISQGVFCMIQQ